MKKDGFSGPIFFFENILQFLQFYSYDCLNIHNADVFQALEIQFIHDDVKRGLTIHYYAKYTILTWENLKGSDLMWELFKKDFVLGYDVLF